MQKGPFDGYLDYNIKYMQRVNFKWAMLFLVVWEGLAANAQPKQLNHFKPDRQLEKTVDNSLRLACDQYRLMMRQLPATPNAFAALLCQLRRSLSLTLEAAGISASGLKGALRLKGLLAIYVAGLRVFANDESEDLAKTMAEVDKRLGQAERLSEMIHRRRPAAA